MTSPHPARAGGWPVQFVEPGYVAMTPAEESAALGALGRLLAWAATQPASATGAATGTAAGCATSMMHPPPG